MKIIIIQGPTASGKSALAIDIAQEYNGCIINADSMQLYKGLPILSAQPSEEEVQHIPHRLFSILEPTEQCSASQWCEKVHHILENEKNKFKTFILVGGTGFYIKSFVEGLSPIPSIPSDQRQMLQHLLSEKGTTGLYELLQEKDPLMAEKLIPQDTQRIMRALEVVLFTQKSLALWQQESKLGALTTKPLSITILPPRDLLYDAINKRVIRMMEQGALEEAKSLWHQHLPLGGIVKTLGYIEIVGYLEKKLSWQEAIEKIQQKSRNYAKRQLTWLRHQTTADITWPHLYVSSPTSLQALALF